MSFFRKLFGLGGAAKATGEDAAPAGHKSAEHKGFSIRATPYKEGAQFQTCGVIAKEVGGSVKEHRFIRADRFASLDEAVEVSLAKGRQIVDEQGERLFG